MLAHPKKFAASGGSYADIYKGYFEGRQVAVKTLRMFQPANEKLKNAQVTNPFDRCDQSRMLITRCYCRRSTEK